MIYTYASSFCPDKVDFCPGQNQNFPQQKFFSEAKKFLFACGKDEKWQFWFSIAKVFLCMQKDDALIESL